MRQVLLMRTGRQESTIAAMGEGITAARSPRNRTLECCRPVRSPVAPEIAVNCFVVRDSINRLVSLNCRSGGRFVRTALPDPDHLIHPLELRKRRVRWVVGWKGESLS
jgi:hypothetical protein